jgi:hypothetical protein
MFPAYSRDPSRPRTCDESDNMDNILTIARCQDASELPNVRYVKQLIFTEDSLSDSCIRPVEWRVAVDR